MEAGDGEALKQWVRSRGAPHGLEPSIKIFHGEVLTDRFLLTLSRADLGRRPGEALLDLARKLRMPPSLENELITRGECCDIVHLGYEGSPAGVMFKMYFEYVLALRRDLPRWKPGDRPILVHFAIKWDPAGSGPGSTAIYTCQPSLSLDDIGGRIAALLPGPGAAALAGELLGRAAEQVPREALLFMEVEEPGNPRRSFDLNVYRASLILDEMEDWISRIWKYFALDTDAMAVIRHAGPEALGHLAGGTDREGREFLSLYFGVEGQR